MANDPLSQWQPETDPAAAFALTVPHDAGRVTRQVLGRFLKKLARDAVTVPDHAVPPEGLEAFRALRAWVGRQAQAPGRKRALLQLLRRSHVHVPLTCVSRALAAGDVEEARRHVAQFAPQLAFEAALEGTLGTTWAWPGPWPERRLVSPVARQLVQVPEGDGVRATFRDGQVTFTVDGGAETVSLPATPSERFVPIAPGLVLALEDTNPISDFEAHPGKQGNQLQLGDADVDDWIASIRQALDLVAASVPTIRQEMALLLQQIVPVGTDDHSHLSASYREAVGTVYMTLHPKLLTMSEATVHEYQHNKVNMLFHLDGVMSNAYWPLYPSPVRPDPRPLHGVLLAAHAFLPVAEMYHRLDRGEHPESRKGGFRDRWRTVIDKNADAMATLEAHAEPTPTGAKLLSEMGAWNRQHLARDRPPLGDDATQQAHEA